MPDVLIIRDLQKDEVAAAAALCARAMADNPAQVAAFGLDAPRRRRIADALFRALLAGLLRRGRVKVATEDRSIVGIAAAAAPGRCDPGLFERAAILAGLLRHGRAETAIRTFRWAKAWKRWDPRTLHWHLGPVAVEPGHQGLGIGTELVRSLVAELTATGVDLYLETDKPENVKFYAALGFGILGEAHVLGARNWFMIAPSRA